MVNFLGTASMVKLLLSFCSNFLLYDTCLIQECVTYYYLCSVVHRNSYVMFMHGKIMLFPML